MLANPEFVHVTILDRWHRRERSRRGTWLFAAPATLGELADMQRTEGEVSLDRMGDEARIFSP
jgi:hypothetical protein